MTWMDLLQLLSEQPYCELQKDIILHSTIDGMHTNWDIGEITFPTEFVDENWHMLWDDWKEGGLMMQITLKPSEELKPSKVWNTNKSDKED